MAGLVAVVDFLNGCIEAVEWRGLAAVLVAGGAEVAFCVVEEDFRTEDGI